MDNKDPDSAHSIAGDQSNVANFTSDFFENSRDLKASLLPPLPQDSDLNSTNLLRESDQFSKQIIDESTHPSIDTNSKDASNPTVQCSTNVELSHGNLDLKINDAGFSEQKLSLERVSESENMESADPSTCASAETILNNAEIAVSSNLPLSVLDVANDADNTTDLMSFESILEDNTLVSESKDNETPAKVVNELDLSESGIDSNTLINTTFSDSFFSHPKMSCQVSNTFNKPDADIPLINFDESFKVESENTNNDLPESIRVKASNSNAEFPLINFDVTLKADINTSTEKVCPASPDSRIGQNEKCTEVSDHFNEDLFSSTKELHQPSETLLENAEPSATQVHESEISIGGSSENVAELLSMNINQAKKLNPETDCNQDEKNTESCTSDIECQAGALPTETDVDENERLDPSEDSPLLSSAKKSCDASDAAEFKPYNASDDTPQTDFPEENPNSSDAATEDNPLDSSRLEDELLASPAGLEDKGSAGEISNLEEDQERFLLDEADDASVVSDQPLDHSASPHRSDMVDENTEPKLSSDHDSFHEPKDPVFNTEEVEDNGTILPEKDPDDIIPNAKPSDHSPLEENSLEKPNPCEEMEIEHEEGSKDFDDSLVVEKDKSTDESLPLCDSPVRDESIIETESLAESSDKNQPENEEVEKGNISKSIGDSWEKSDLQLENEVLSEINASQEGDSGNLAVDDKKECSAPVDESSLVSDEKTEVKEGADDDAICKGVESDLTNATEKYQRSKNDDASKDLEMLDNDVSAEPSREKDLSDSVAPGDEFSTPKEDLPLTSDQSSNLDSRVTPEVEGEKDEHCQTVGKAFVTNVGSQLYDDLSSEPFPFSPGDHVSYDANSPLEDKENNTSEEANSVTFESKSSQPDAELKGDQPSIPSIAINSGKSTNLVEEHATNDSLLDKEETEKEIKSNDAAQQETPSIQPISPETFECPEEEGTVSDKETSAEKSGFLGEGDSLLENEQLGDKISSGQTDASLEEGDCLVQSHGDENAPGSELLKERAPLDGAILDPILSDKEANTEGSARGSDQPVPPKDCSQLDDELFAQPASALGHLQGESESSKKEETTEFSQSKDTDSMQVADEAKAIVIENASSEGKTLSTVDEQNKGQDPPAASPTKEQSAESESELATSSFDQEESKSRDDELDNIEASETQLTGDDASSDIVDPDASSSELDKSGDMQGELQEALSESDINSIVQQADIPKKAVCDESVEEKDLDAKEKAKGDSPEDDSSLAVIEEQASEPIKESVPTDEKSQIEDSSTSELTAGEDNQAGDIITSSKELVEEMKEPSATADNESAIADSKESSDDASKSNAPKSPVVSLKVLDVDSMKNSVKKAVLPAILRRDRKSKEAQKRPSEEPASPREESKKKPNLSTPRSKRDTAKEKVTPVVDIEKESIATRRSSRRVDGADAAPDIEVETITGNLESEVIIVPDNPNEISGRRTRRSTDGVGQTQTDSTIQRPKRNAALAADTKIKSLVSNSMDSGTLEEVEEPVTQQCEQCKRTKLCRFQASGHKLCSEDCHAAWTSRCMAAAVARTCAQCQNEIQANRVLSWETMDFCKDSCLDLYQRTAGSHCTNCGMDVPVASMGKFCVRFGHDIRQFCKPTCLDEYKKGLKVCTFCQKDISDGSQGFLAPVGDKGQFKDFCSQACMGKYEQTAGACPDDVAECAVCSHSKRVTVQVLVGAKLHKLCSKPCFAAFKFVNNISEGRCVQCKRYFDRSQVSQLSIYSDDRQLLFCCKTCLSVYVLSNRKIVSCINCGVRKYNFDMIRKTQNSGSVMACSLTCLSQSVVSKQKKISCDNCLTSCNAQFKLPISDGTSRNLCSYGCTVAYQKRLSHSTLSATGAAVQMTVSPVRSTRAMATEPMPVPTRVQQLPPPPPPPPKVVTLPPPPPEIHQHIIVRPSEPKKCVNKSVICKPYMHNKGTSCRPMPCYKETQTDESLTRKCLIPVPVPIYVPVPMHMYTTPIPTPVPFPLPVPVPFFIPTTRNSAKGIFKEIKKIQEKIPTDPFEAELLMMAEMVAGEKKQEPTDSESDDGADGDVPGESFSPEPVDTSNAFGVGDDVLQIALKMASEMDEPAVDMESVLTPSTITPSAQPTVDSKAFYVTDDPSHMMAMARGRKRPVRGGRGGMTPSKRGRRSGPEGIPPIMAPVEVVPPPRIEVEKPDANMCLKYTFGVNAWRHWVMQKNAELEKAALTNRKIKPFKPELLQLTADELNFSLCLFVKEVKKPSGQEYAPDTIYYLCLGVQQYLFENGRIDNIFTDTYYEKFTDCLDEVAKKFAVLYNDSQFIVTRVEEEHLWESKQLGAHSPHVLLSTLMFFNTKHFNLVTVEEHMQLSFSHIMKHWKRNPNAPSVAKIPGSRNVLLRFYPPQSALEANSKKKKVYEQQENEENPLRCPVKLYEFYLSKCPESVKTRNDVFYLLPERSCVPDSPVWYSTMALGKEPLMKMLNRIKMVKEINVALLAS